MSRKATWEYVGVTRRRYSEAGPQEKARILDEFVETTSYSRKYANKLLTGNRMYRERRGRGKTYGEETAKILERIWRESGCMNSKYLKAKIADWVEDYETHVAVIPARQREEIVRMSASTMDRIFRGKKRNNWTGLPSTSNRRSGRNNNPLKASVPCRSGEETMACLVPPGDVQVDTFALGGGDPSENFWWILDGTDRNLQWTWMAPCWNRGAEATVGALRHIGLRFPFPIRSIHSDNGGEFINHHLLREFPSLFPGAGLSRSRPRKCNDNAHVEQKNGAVGRKVFGEMRIDVPEAGPVLERLCDAVSLYNDFFRPCKMLISKEKRENGKGFRCVYDDPQTPLDRLLSSGVLSEKAAEKLILQKKKTSAIELLDKIKRLLRKIINLQKKIGAERGNGSFYCGTSSTGSALRAAPSGTPVELVPQSRRNDGKCPVFDEP